MNGHYRTIASLGVIALFIFGGVLTATANRTSSDKAAAAPNVWTPKSTDWPTFHDNNARTGLTAATATMKFAYYKWTVKTGGQVISSPAVATVNTSSGGLNNLGTKVFVGSYDDRLYCIDGKSGNIVWRYQTTGIITSSPAVGDINGDGIAEVVFGCNDCRIYALCANNGTLLWKYTTRDVVDCSPALADLKGDGKLETVMGSEDGKLYAINGDGSLFWSLRIGWGGGALMSTAAVTDINGDGRPEIVIRTESDDTYAFNASDGSTLWDYMSPVNSHSFSGSIIAGPSAADLDGDGHMEVLAIDSPNGMSCVNGSDGTVKWQQVFNGNILTTPAIGDIDGDGKLEAVFSTSNFAVVCIDGQTGETKWTHDFKSAQYSSPALADIDGDGKLEVLTGGGDRIMHCLNAEDGSVRWAYPCANIIQSSPAVADIDGDGKAEVVFGCNDARVYALDYNF